MNQTHGLVKQSVRTDIRNHHYGVFVCLFGFLIRGGKNVCLKKNRVGLQILPENTRCSLMTRMNYHNNRAVNFDRKGQ